ADLLRQVLPLDRWPDDGNVADLQTMRLARQSDEIQRLRSQRSRLLATSRANLKAQARVQAAARSLIGAASLHQFLDMIATDLPHHLGLDTATLCIEGDARRLASAIGANSSGPDGGALRLLAPGSVDRILGPGQDIQLLADKAGDEALFGELAGLVRSRAVLRLTLGPTTPAGVLALGSRRAGLFAPDQGSDLLRFLAGLIERGLMAWLRGIV
ncbi:MAG: DUF484 family protein, partial [Alphaproteobacteria bacterium]